MDELRIDISNDDIDAARAAYIAARDGGAPITRAECLLDMYGRLVDAQAQQVAEGIRGTHLA